MIDTFDFVFAVSRSDLGLKKGTVSYNSKLDTLQFSFPTGQS